MNTYQIYTDRAVYVITSLILLFLIGVFITFYFLIPKINALFIINLLIAFIPIVLTYIYSPQQYILEHEVLTIEKVIGSLNIKKSDVKKITKIEKDDLNGTIRLFASGGMFKYFGKFSNHKLGKFEMYSGSVKQNLVLIELKSGRKIVISPDNPDTFIDEFRNVKSI